MTSLAFWRAHFVPWMVGLPPVADLSPVCPEDATNGADLVDPVDG